MKRHVLHLRTAEMVNRQGTIDEINLSDEDEGGYWDWKNASPSSYRNGGSDSYRRQHYSHKPQPSWSEQVNIRNVQSLALIGRGKEQISRDCFRFCGIQSRIPRLFIWYQT